MKTDQRLTIRNMTLLEHMTIEFTKATMIGIISASGKEAHNWSSEDFANAGLSQAQSVINALNK